MLADDTARGGRARGPAKPIRFLLSDVDGTLVTKQKELTPAAIDAVRRLGQANIGFAVTSSRPPRGMRMLVPPLSIETPLAGFNGGLYVDPDMTPIAAHSIPEAAVHTAIAGIEGYDIDVWVFAGNEWYVRNLAGPHVERETRAVQFSPLELKDFSRLDLQTIGKIVAVSDDAQKMDQCQNLLRQSLGGVVSASRSQSYYIDITNPAANKGAVVDYFAGLLHLDHAEIAVIGDMENDIRMFDKAGLAIAMGNAHDDVKQQADYVTASNDDDGFAKAVERFILA